MPKLSGRYQTIGVSSFYLQQPAAPSQPAAGDRPSSQQADERLELVVKVFYPSSSASPPPPSAPYISNEQASALAAFGGVPAFLFSHLPKIKVRAVEAAPVLPESELAPPLPVVLYSHGLGGLPETYTVQACDLASRGFVVFLPTHNDRSASISILPDGRRIPYEKVTGFEEERRVRSAGLVKRVDELLFLLDTLTDSGTHELPFASPHLRTSLLPRLDRSRVAVIGHSFGAATAMAVACYEQLRQSKLGRPSRISAVVCHDPWMLPQHPLISDVKLSTPALITVSEGFRNWHQNFEVLQQLYEALPAAANSRMLVVHQSMHSNFSDVGVFSPLLTRLAGQLGKIDHVRCWSLLNDYNALWCGRAMKLPPDSPQLENLSTDLLDQGAPEVQWLQ